MSTMIVIAEFGDLTIKVVDYDGDDKNKNKGTNNQQPDVPRTQEFRVSRQTLVENSPVFQQMLTSQSFAEEQQDVVVLEEDRICSMTI